ncbi:MAG: FAD-binding protein [Dehalococcoidales bacterium]|nr:FAD-binding protein [Dehalococcoidales bacterium]
MNYIVLVKQVPDVKNIPNEAWDWEKGTLKRGLLDNVCNEFDKQALAFAIEMREQKYGKILALSMGPPFAEEVLKYALSIGADMAVLLTDRSLGGADTAATAYPLAQAIRKIQKDFFIGDSNYTIISGMQSVDGDTAQVPPQIAEDLGIVHIAYTTSFSFNNNELQVSRITRRGLETVTPLDSPCMVTVANFTEPPFATFSRTRWAASQQITKWSAEDINADPSLIGLSGSRTTVFKIFSPKDVSDRQCLLFDKVPDLVKKLEEAFVNNLESSDKKEEGHVYSIPEGRKPSYQGEIWVYAEQEGGEINPATFELLGKATGLARSLGEKVGAVLLGKNIKNLTMELIKYGAEKVYIADHVHLKNFLPVPYAMVISDLIEQYKPQIMLFSATPLGRELAPRVAYRTRSGLTADCTGLDLVDFQRGKQDLVGVLKQTRPALGGNIMASIITQNSNIQMSTARPGVMKALEPSDKRQGEVINYAPSLTENDLREKIISAEVCPSVSDIKEAAAIVCGGAGCKNKDTFDKYIIPLAEKLSSFLDVEGMVGASRAAVEMGFIDRSHQVGQTGQTVKPKVYIAVGVSGAVQHITGMHNSDIIIAINRDSKAPIFKVCDFGIVGNMEEVVPQLIKALDSKNS